jgi:predicted porin
MKKTLVALAALAATSVFAQSSVSITGGMDIGWKTQTHKGTSGTGAKAAGISDGAMIPSRINFAGTEDLGGGMKAMFMTEIGISPTNDELTGVRTGNSGIQWDSALNRTTAETAALKQGASGYSQNTNRQTWVGASGGFGEIRAGYMTTTMYQLSSQTGYNQTFEGLVGADVFHTHGNTFVGGTRGNAIQYTKSNLVNGLNATVQYGTGNGRQTLETDNGGTKDNLSRTGIKLDYAAGPLKASYGHTSATTVTTNSILTANAQGETVTTPSAADAKASLNQYIGSYNFGVATVTYLINDGESKQNIASGTGATAVAAGATTKFKSNQLTVSAPIGAYTLRYSTGNLSTNSPYTAGALDSVKVKGSQFGASYALSKRSTVYAMTGKTKDTGSAASAWNAQRSSTAIGLAHAF